MSILGLQRRIAEVGRLRIGQQVPTQSGKTRPAKLETWRVTSADRQRIEQIARMYGGQVKPWKSPNGDQWEVITDIDVLPVIVPPPVMAFSMKYELWSAGGCQRRCDGEQEAISDGPCLCDPDNRDCDIHTRLSVMLRDVPGLGVYRLDTQGYYAAVELSGAVEIISLAASRGQMLPARLRLEQRSVKRQVNGKPETRRFPVPVLDIDIAPGQLVLGTSPDLELTQAEDPRPPSQDTITAAAPRKTIAEQIEEDQREMARAKQRQPAELPTAPPPQTSSRRAPAIPATGRRPRTQAEVAAKQLAEDGRPLTDLADPRWEKVDQVVGAKPTQQHTGTIVDDRPTQQQLRHMFALFEQHHLDSRENSLNFVEQTTGRRVESRNELTAAEVSKIIDALIDKNLAAIDVDPDTGEELPQLDQPTLNGNQ